MSEQGRCFVVRTSPLPGHCVRISSAAPPCRPAAMLSREPADRAWGQPALQTGASGTVGSLGGEVLEGDEAPGGPGSHTDLRMLKNTTL